MDNTFAQSINDNSGFKCMKDLTLAEFETLFFLSTNKLLKEAGEAELIEDHIPDKVPPMVGAILLFMTTNIRDFVQQCVTLPVFRFGKETDPDQLSHVIGFLSDIDHFLSARTQEILGALK